MAGSNPDNRENPSDVYVNQVLSLDSAGINAYFEALMLEKIQEKRPDFLDETRFFTGIGCGGINALILAQTRLNSLSDKKMSVGSDGIRLCLEFWQNSLFWGSFPLPGPPSAPTGAAPAGGFNMAGPIKPILEKYLKPWTLRTLRDDGVFVVIVAYEPNPKQGGRIEPRIYSNLPESDGVDSLDLDKSLIDIAEHAFSAPLVQLLDQWAIAAGTAPPNPIVLALSEARKIERFDDREQEKYIGRRYSKVSNRVLSIGGGKTDAAAWNDSGLNAAWGPGKGGGSGTEGGAGLFGAGFGAPGTGGGLFGAGGGAPGTGGGWFGAGGGRPGTGGGWPGTGGGLFGAAADWLGKFGTRGSTDPSSGPAPGGGPEETCSPFNPGFDVNNLAYQWLSLVSKWSRCYTTPSNSAVELTEREARGFLGSNYLRLDPPVLEISPYFATLGVSMNPDFVQAVIEGLKRDAEKEETRSAVDSILGELSSLEKQ